MPRKTKYRTELDVRFISFYDFLMGTDRKPSTCEYGNLSRERKLKFKQSNTKKTTNRGEDPQKICS